jgi:hypothetical protein
MSDPSADAITAVRFLVGDPVGGTGTTTQLSDLEIQFALDQAGEDVYAAAAICARAIAARYSRRVKTRFETIETDYSKLSGQFYALARSLDKQSGTYGSRKVGIPIGGGIEISEVNAAQDDPNRVKPFFSDSMFANPPSSVTRPTRDDG